MNIDEFKRIITTFADTATDIDMSKGALLVQVRDDVIAATVSTREGQLVVTENGDTTPAARWIVQRIARLPLLADRLVGAIPHQATFVLPDGHLLDQIDEMPDDVEQYRSDAASTAFSILNRRLAGTTSVLYLTSDAGEGKTTLISEMARQQAIKYKEKKADWLLVPVSLGGRTFMRFDDVIVGTLMNRFRFNLLYYDAFVELVRLGVLVPVLDGFEEMFVEGTAGDAISALGNLMQAMKSSGAVMIAARKAYFEYKNLRALTRMFDSLGGQSVTFSRIALKRWDADRFLEYAEKRNIPFAKGIYDEVSSVLTPEHPLLCRAVLVKRLLDVASVPETRSRLLHSITHDPSDYFRQFIGSIIQRESLEKWIDKNGEPPEPLISEDEHYELLSHLAAEMWETGNENLSADVVDFTAEMFSESKGKSAALTHQIVERVKQHALIVSRNDGRFGFDHPEFYHFFLGESLGNTLVQNDVPRLKALLRQGSLPHLTMEAAARFVARKSAAVRECVSTVNSVFSTEPKLSIVRENLSGIIIHILDIAQVTDCVVAGGAFPPDALRARQFSKLVFRDSVFRRTSLDKSQLADVSFVGCDIEGLDINETSRIDRVELSATNVRSVIPKASDTTVFAPASIVSALIQAGFNVTESLDADQPQRSEAEVQEQVKAVERLLRAFIRSPSGINENTIRQRLGSHAAVFFRDVCPALVDRGLIEEMEYRGSGTQRRYRVCGKMDHLNRALEECGGDFNAFLRLARS